MNVRDRFVAVLPWGAAVLSGLLLFAAFPPLGWQDAAWIALIPLVLGVRGVSLRRAAMLGFLAGAAFWIPSIAWLRYVTRPGWIGLALYCSFYMIPFAWVAAYGMKRWGSGGSFTNIGQMLLGVAVWIGFEYLRSILFTGFPWNQLGVSQYRNIPIIQVARWGGVYAVSALVVWINMAIALTLLRYVETRDRWSRRAHPELMLGFLAVVVAVVQGWRSVRMEHVPTESLRVAIVQPLIPIAWYYMPEQHDVIRERLEHFSTTALRAGTPDLLIWPETAIPDELRTSQASYDMVAALASRGVPILTGSIDTEWTDEGPRYFNSSFLVDTNGIVVKGYDKRHLVMFGEYVPLQAIMPWLRAITPITESFTPGSSSSVFRLERPDVSFSVLICFEDTVSSLARESVRNGARLLVNQTDDGWFDAHVEPLQHMMHCVFRCVENGVPAVRAANTGVSCAIDRRGRVYDVLDDGFGDTFIAGFRFTSVEVPGQDMPLTFYTRHGDLFARLCALAAMAFLICMGIERKRAGRTFFRPEAMKR